VNEKDREVRKNQSPEKMHCFCFNTEMRKIEKQNEKKDRKKEKNQKGRK